MMNDSNSSEPALTDGDVGSVEMSHVGADGKARMVDVGDKRLSRRTAIARGVCNMLVATGEAIRGNTASKGDVLAVARLAGIMAAKRTDELIPLCHNVPLEQVSVEFVWLTPASLEVTATAVCTGKTGVEMEALVAASIACLTVYDMCKAVDREMQIEHVHLVHKSGGVKGDYTRNGPGT